ncbi:MAG: ABC transporter ATP-binding protein, partial [Prochlorothrix sp.]
GVNPTLVQLVCGAIRFWHREGVSFLVIEHNMDVIMGLCDWVWVMAEGRNLVDGPPDRVRQDAQVLEAYLGVA